MAATAAVLAGGLVPALVFPTARRVLALLTIPLHPWAPAFWPTSIFLVRPWATGAGEIPIVYLSPLLILGVAIVAARRSGRPAIRREDHDAHAWPWPIHPDRGLSG